MMSVDGKKTAKAESSDYEVGYRKPPKKSRFKPGQSGNPRGRSKGTRNLKTDLAEELGETILVQEGGEPRKLSKQRAVVKSLVNRTLKGDARAASTLLSVMMRLLDTGEGSEVDDADDLHEDELEILEAFKKRFPGEDANEIATHTADDQQKDT